VSPTGLEPMPRTSEALTIQYSPPFLSLNLLQLFFFFNYLLALFYVSAISLVLLHLLSDIGVDE
jgi:hypothetical protein